MMHNLSRFIDARDRLSREWARCRSIGTIVLVLFTMALLIPAQATGTVLTADTTWSGAVTLEADVLVPAGVKLTIAPGATVHVTPSDSTKTDPEYLSPLTEITVRGTIDADGTEDAPVTFVLDGDGKASWAGIIVDGGKALLRSVRISGADSALTLFGGSLDLERSLIAKNRYGLTVQGPDASVRVRKSTIRENDYGVVLLGGAKIDGSKLTVTANRKKDNYSALAKDSPVKDLEYSRSGEAGETSRVYKDDALVGTTIWRGRVRVNGIVRVPAGSRLVIVPGTLVEFGKKDTNGDGIGENGLLVQGTFIAKGTRERPILFRSAEARRERGDWDSINLMNSDQAQNLIEFCQIEDAYRGLHFHYSTVAVSDSVVRNSYRGIQFQESLVAIRRTHLYGNKSGLQARDSEITFTDNVIQHNYTGMNIFRNSIVLTGNVIMNNLQEGLRVREGLPVVERNLIAANRQGMLVNDAVYGTFASNVISRNLESGISLRGDNNIEVTGNAVQANGLFGITIQDTGALIRGNLVADNGERGIGILSFQGSITENNILRNGLYDLGVEGAGDVSAPKNWWGGADVRKTVYDKADDPSKGRADLMPLGTGPVLFTWPLPEVRTDTSWHGDIAVSSRVTVENGASLLVTPGTGVLFSPGAGLTVRGTIVARGELKAPITFAPRVPKGAGDWDEIVLDHAAGSAFSHCVFRNATWALHSHFTDLKVADCSFTGNYGGMRFTSGPLEVRRSLFEGNEIGIRDFRGTALITENVIRRNRIGIFVREKGAGLTVRKNDFVANQDYSIRLGDFNNEDVDARENYWGGGNPPDTFYDATREPGIGKVIYEPYARKPFDLVPSVAGTR